MAARQISGYLDQLPGSDEHHKFTIPGLPTVCFYCRISVRQLLRLHVSIVDSDRIRLSRSISLLDASRRCRRIEWLASNYRDRAPASAALRWVGWCYWRLCLCASPFCSYSPPCPPRNGTTPRPACSTMCGPPSSACLGQNRPCPSSHASPATVPEVASCRKVWTMSCGLSSWISVSRNVPSAAPGCVTMNDG